MHRHRRKEKTCGFTFVEMIVTVALTVTLTIMVMEGIAAFYRYNGYALAQSYQIAHARNGVELMVRDLREMTFADDGAFPLVTMGTHQIGFYSDIDRDDSVEYVEYALASTTFVKRIYNATGSTPQYSTTSPDATIVISEYVQNLLQGTPVFVYYDMNGAPATATSTVTDIRYVEVNVIVNIDPVRDPGQYQLRSSASLRNLKLYE